MWIHVVIFVMILCALTGWKKGWIPSSGIGGKDGIRLFAVVAIAGNLLGMILTLQNGGQVYPQGYRLEKEDTGSYEKEFMVSVDGEEPVSMYITLLVQAGMTVRKAFQKISLDYGRKRKRNPRPAYEEIRIVCYEMESGVSESEAYRRFGERCGQAKYKTFATLLIQNLQKGSRQMADMLERESTEAWEERKRKARVLGEAAATKLLVPMIMMLIVVMAIVMIPAFMSFYGET